MRPPVLEVDLALPPSERWRCLVGREDAIRALIASYTRDLGGTELFREALGAYREALVPAELLAEMDAIAEIAGAAPIDVLLANAYYDVFKHVLGCTAFAVDTPEGPLHARNLDWWTENDALAEHTVVVRYHRSGTTVFEAVTWPGFIGVLSGSAPGRFSVTLNAVLSDEAPGIATPVGLQLREALTRATFEEARATLASSPLACDCLLLLVGTRPGEMCVVERTPSRAATRGPENGVIAVSNDFRALAAPGWTTETNALSTTSCGRLDRALARVRDERPNTVDACLDVLEDAGVRMKITVQQMVFSASRGLTWARGVRASG